MKYDLNKKITRGAQRTLEAFSNTMFDLLAKKSVESITVNELCEISNFPRATFYNYFDDKYDLLNYCWYLISKQLQLEQHKQLSSKEALTIFFDRIYHIFLENMDSLTDILRHNPPNSYLVNHFNAYFKQVMQGIFYECLEFQDHTVPLEIIADHFSNTVLLILEWIFIKQRPITLDEAHNYLISLLGEL
ncbi:TetR/AcrR family transcriptional regulator [Paenibacillus sp. CGMCC 1.18879]|uniref:TetR/AcrR family transcriptional regulator n=1 Tax=Paenibacillus sp. CGMCC 1.18879 TaxID=2834466 RepID=UPI001CA9CCB2|nr:TetR/AcrR family transcriptional regulator [Paenibacillus sp. CGMCC 1.18879]MBY9079357.1 TetR/AcrR family transcriptional regulator [Paenibacillus sp. CGMCC 1.18879]